MADDAVDDTEASIDFLHQLAGAGNRLDHVRALARVRDLVRELAPAPVLGLVDDAVVALDDLLDLRVQIRDRLFGRVGRRDVDELVLSLTHDSPSGLSGGAFATQGDKV